MQKKKHQLLYEHYKTTFNQDFSFSVSSKDTLNHITTLIFEPTEEMPFWKLCTIGASDYKMPKRDIGLGRKANRRNEYVMFISPETSIGQDTSDWLYLNSILWATAHSTSKNDINLTVSDTIDMELDGKYCGIVLLLPEIMKSPKICKCYVSKREFISIFQVMPITREQLDKKLEKGIDGKYWLMEQFYTHDDEYKLISSHPFTTL